MMMAAEAKQQLSLLTASAKKTVFTTNNRGQKTAVTADS
jgi:hypothetical protein